MRKMYSKKQIEEIVKSSAEGGKVYLHNIYIDGSISGYMKLYTTNNEPFTKNTLASFMENNGITSKEKGFPLCYSSSIGNESNVLNFNYVVLYRNGVLAISSEGIKFDFTNNNVILTKINNNAVYASSVTDTVIEL